jgi:restriction system protein
MSGNNSLPKYDDLFKPTLTALKALGGSGSIEELDDALFSTIGTTQEQLDITYPTSGASVLPDRTAWARSFLKVAGLVANPKRGVWVLTEEGRVAAEKSNVELKQIVRAAYKASIESKKATQSSPEDGADQGIAEGEVAEGVAGWSAQLLQRLKMIDPAAFERLCQRFLRVSGFTRVEITGKSGDGRIDGMGVLRMNLISFQVLFQCKRWKGSVSSEVVRNFRGAMQGRADKGLIITTGTFTAEARKEATRDGAPAIRPHRRGDALRIDEGSGAWCPRESDSGRGGQPGRRVLRSNLITIPRFRAPP